CLVFGLWQADAFLDAVVSSNEYFLYMPAVALLAAALGCLAWALLNVPRLLALWRDCAPDCESACERERLARRRYVSALRHGTFALLLTVAPALPLELEHVNTLLTPRTAALLSLLVSAAVHACYWACGRRDVELGANPDGRRTYFIWAALLDLGVARLA